jgi:hypothetical protein
MILLPLFMVHLLEIRKGNALCVSGVVFTFAPDTKQLTMTPSGSDICRATWKKQNKLCGPCKI